MHSSTTRPLLAPTLGTGGLMAAYLLLRPYGDTGSDLDVARALASTSWVVAHVCGAAALACFGWLTVRLHDAVDGTATRVARATGLLGTMLVLPYYGAETFGLHAVGVRAVAGDTTALDLVDQIRNQPAAITAFGLGLLLLAVAGITTAVAWSRADLAGPTWAAWPLGVAVALVLPQFYLPPSGRMAYGVAYLVAALLLAAGSAGSRGPATRERPQPVTARQ